MKQFCIYRQSFLLHEIVACLSSKNFIQTLKFKTIVFLNLEVSLTRLTMLTRIFTYLSV